MHHSIEDVNFARDSRNCERDAERTLDMPQPDGSYVTVTLPTTWVVCPTCSGRGSHVNPAIDCNGLTAEDFAADPDFAEEYFSGSYDQVCNRCAGRTTVREIDYARLTDEQRAQLDAEAEADAAMEAERLAEIRFGC